MALLSIIAKLGLDSTGFKAGIKQAESATKGLSRDLNSNLKGAIAGAFGVAAITAATKATIDYGGHISDLADRLNVSTDALQEFDFAARIAGANVDTFTGFLEKLGSARDDALEGNEDIIRSFNRLGVSLEDLKTKRIEDITRQIGRSVQSGNSQDLIGALKDVGGKSAGQLIPTFKLGLDEAAKQARDSGAIISEADIFALDEAGDKLAVMAHTLKVQLAPAIVFVSDAITAFIRGVKNAGAFFGGFFGGGMEGAQQALADQEAQRVAEASAVAQAAAERRQREAGGAVGARGQRASAIETQDQRIAKIREQIADKELKLLPAAEQRLAAERRIAELRKQIADLSVVAAEDRDAEEQMLKKQAEVLDAQAQLKALEPAVRNQSADPSVNALERIGFSFGKTDRNAPQVRHLENINRGIAAANNKLDRIATATGQTAEAIA